MEQKKLYKVSKSDDRFYRLAAVNLIANIILLTYVKSSNLEYLAGLGVICYIVKH